MRFYSNSQLATFDTCPQKYKFKYIDKLRKPEEESIEAFVGTCAHEVLRKLYADLLLSKLNSLDELLAYYRTVWEQDYQSTFVVVRKDLTPQNYFDYGAQCVRDYYERYKPFDQSRTLDTEARIVFALDAQGEYRFQGFVDRIARRPDGTYEIHDYKTGGNLPPQEKIDTDRQLGLYEIGLRERWPDAERVDLVWHYLGFDTTLRSRRTPEQLKELTEQTIAAIDRIEREREFEPDKNAPCDWCEYRPDCPLWKHVAAVESLPPAQFAADTGVRLANEYVQTKFEADQLARRLADLREKIIEFAREQQARVLMGNGVRVTVTSREHPRFPAKHEPSRAQLGEFLREIGKWDEVTDLNLHQLEKVLLEAQWPAHLLEQLRQFATTESAVTVRVSRSEAREESEE